MMVDGAAALIEKPIYIEEYLEDIPTDGTVIWVLTAYNGRNHVVQQMYAGIFEDDPEDAKLRWFCLPENEFYCDVGNEKKFFVAWGHVEKPTVRIKAKGIPA